MRRDVARVVLQIAVGGDDQAAPRVGEAGGEGRRLAEVAAEPDDAHTRVRRLKRRQELEAVVRAAVVDDDELVRSARALERVGQLAGTDAGCSATRSGWG